VRTPNRLSLWLAPALPRVIKLLCALCCVLVSNSCGSSPSAPSSADATITIGAMGVSPTEVRIKAWGHVMFVNNDDRPHAIASDPVQTHSDCPGINQVGFLSPGESRLTGTLNLSRTCGFHDHNDEFNPAFKGRIVVQ
jgi:plastocyanin